MGVAKVRAIILDLIGVDSILLDPAIPEVLYFKHDSFVSQIIIFIGSSGVDNIANTILVLYNRRCN